MIEKDYKVLRADSLSEVEAMLEQACNAGWKSTGFIEYLNGVYVQPISITIDLDDTVEITQDITEKLL